MTITARTSANGSARTIPDVFESALVHFSTIGWREGRKCHPIFDTAHYLHHNPNVASSGTNALAHFHYAMSLWKGDSEALDADDARRVEALLRRAIALDPKLTKGFFELGETLADQ